MQRNLAGRLASCSVVRETPNLANGKQQVASPSFTRPLLGHEAWCKKCAWWTEWVESPQRVTFVIINSYRTSLSPKHARQIRRRRTSRGREGHFSGGWVRALQGPKRNVTRKAMRWKKSSRPRSIHPWLLAPHGDRQNAFCRVAHYTNEEFYEHGRPLRRPKAADRDKVLHMFHCPSATAQLWYSSCARLAKPLRSAAETDAGWTLKWVSRSTECEAPEPTVEVVEHHWPATKVLRVRYWTILTRWTFKDILGHLLSHLELCDVQRSCFLRAALLDAFPTL